MNPNACESRLLFGTGLSSSKDFKGLYAVALMAMERGIVCFDTAPSYRMEQTLGAVLSEGAKAIGLRREDFLIQTKIDPLQMLDGNIAEQTERAMEKLRVSYLDALLIHWPVVEETEACWRVFERLKERGLVCRIGICNVRTRHIRRYWERGVRPDIIQIERNPLRVCAEETELCRRLGIELQAYSPLCKMDERIADSPLLAEIAKRYGKSVGQVVLRWHLDTGFSPVFTSKKPERVREYSDIFDFRLTPQEIERVCSLNVNYKMYLESCICPGF